VALAEEYVSVFSTEGELLNTFGVGLAENQMIRFLEVDPNGDIWVGRFDRGHGTMQFNPNDQAVRFSPDGIEQQIVKGPTRYQTSIGFVSSGDLYIGAKPDGGALGDKYVYVFGSDGVFDFQFGGLNDDVTDFLVIEDDRIFATTGNTMILWEFNTAGTEINRLQVNGYFGGPLALDTSVPGSQLWSYEARNGPGNNRIAAYDLDLTPLSSFELDHIGNPYLAGLEALPSGELVTVDRSTGVFYLLEPDGTVAETGTLPDITEVLKFTLDNEGNIVIAHANSLLPTTPIPTSNAWGVALLVVLIGLLSSLHFVRRRIIF
jgi:hypothetical protein